MFRKLAADDIFISYSRADAATYADSLAGALVGKGFSVFIDRLGTEANALLPMSLVDKLRRASMLVIVGSASASQSEFVGQEIAVFADAGRSDRIVPISFAGAVASATWYGLVRGIPIEYESDAALATGDVSPSVVSRIDKAFSYTRSKDRLRRYMWGASGLLAFLLLLSAGASIFAGYQLEVAAAADQQATESRESERAADGRASVAQERATSAAASAAAAETQRLGAEKARDEATTLAQAAKREAVRQQNVAAALRLANESELARGTTREDLEKSLRLAVQSVERQPTSAGSGALRTGLALVAQLRDERNFAFSSGPVWTSAGGRTVAFRGAPDQLHVWKGATRDWHETKPSLVLGLPADHVRAAVSDDGRYVASASNKGIRLHDTLKGTSCDHLLPEEDDQAFVDIALSGKDGYLAALVVNDEQSSLSAWRVNEGETGTCKWKSGSLQLGDVQFNRPEKVRFSSEESTLVTLHGSQDHAGAYYAFMRLLQIVAGPAPRGSSADTYRLVEHSMYRNSLGVGVAEARGGNLIALANSGRKTCWVLRRNLFGGYDEVVRVPLQGKVVGAAFDGGLLSLFTQIGTSSVKRHIWDINGVAGPIRLVFEQELTKLGALPDGRFFTVHEAFDGSPKRRVWNSVDGKEERSQLAAAAGAGDESKVPRPELGRVVRARSVDGKYVAISSGAGAVRVLDAVGGEPISQLHHEDLVTAATFSRDRRHLAVATSPASPDTRGGELSTVHIWQLDEQDLIREACKHVREACRTQPGAVQRRVQQ